jgi:hypothetical protein
MNLHQKCGRPFEVITEACGAVHPRELIRANARTLGRKCTRRNQTVPISTLSGCTS